MKKYIKNIMLICAVAVSVIACKEDEIDMFSGTDELYFKWSVDGFTNTADKIDSVSVSFAFDLPNVVDSIFNIPVNVLGKLYKNDRPFNVEVLPESTAVEGIDFEIPQNIFVPADSVSAMIPITLFRTDKLKDTEVSIKVRLVPNEYFNTNFYGSDEKADTNELLKYNEFELTMSDVLKEPKYWTLYLHYYLGDYSRKKFTLFALVNNIPIPNWESSPPAITTFFGQVAVLKAYLLEQINNGTPVLEEDGTVMVLGPFA